MDKSGSHLRVALLHAGYMRTNRPDPEDVHLMDSLAISGFDIVAASHSHRISGYRHIKTFRDRQSFCFYGLGSLVSGYISSYLEREGLIVVAALTAEGHLVEVEIRAVLIDKGGFGQIPAEEDGTVMLDRFHNLSGEIDDGSYAKLFYHDASQGLVKLYLQDVRAAFHSAGVCGLSKKARRIRFRHVRRLVHKVIN
jgi:hypothetical protein